MASNVLSIGSPRFCTSQREIFYQSISGAQARTDVQQARRALHGVPVTADIIGFTARP
jgi:hypothetical protein